MMLIHLKPLMLSPIIITIASCERPVTSSHKMYFSEISKSMKTLIDIINIFTGKWKQKERAREKKRKHKREKERDIQHAYTHALNLTIVFCRLSIPFFVRPCTCPIYPSLYETFDVLCCASRG